jgi:hypothetical protein
MDDRDGAERELDATIYLTAFGDRPYGVITGNKHQVVGVGTLSGYVEAYRDVLTADDALHDDVVPRYTASLDAAMTLIPAGLTWEVSTDYVPALAGIYSGTDDDDGLPAYQGEAATPALALCAAALRARASTPSPEAGE